MHKKVDFIVGMYLQSIYIDIYWLYSIYMHVYWYEIQIIYVYMNEYGDKWICGGLTTHTPYKFDSYSAT